jgi:hypothetical protein
MGGIGSHHGHPYALQTAAFVVSMLLPGSALALVAGAYWEQFRRRTRNRRRAEQVTTPATLAAEWGSE